MWSTPPPTLKILRLSIIELSVLTSPIGYHWQFVCSHCTCAISRDLCVDGNFSHIFEIPDPDLPIHCITFMALWSHTHTVVRECCKGDDQSQWRRANFDPPPPLNPSTDLHQNFHRWLSRRCLPPCKIYSRSDKGFCFRACATSRTKLFTPLFFGVQEITYSQDAPTNFDAQYVKRRGSWQGCAFLESQNLNLTFILPFSQKTANFRPDFVLLDRSKNSFNIGSAKSKWPLNVIVAP